QQEKIEEQEAKILELQNELNRKTITLKESGSIAEATLALNGVFEAAQAAADQYLLSIKEKNSQGEKDE
ncbi:DNA repair protein, partial [Streptococcus pyogenes]